MADRHPHPDTVLDLALGHLDEPRRSEVVAHLLGCRPCRRQHDELAAVVEQTLAAVPRKEPPAGFDTAVLDRIRGADRPERTRVAGVVRRRGWTRRGVALVTAAAAALGLVVGGITSRLLTQGEETRDTSTVLAAGRALRTDDGGVVGYVDRSWSGSGWSLVVNVTDGPDGARYLCRVTTAGGEVREVGDWSISADRGNSWVVPEPEGGARAVELVRPDHRVWARADLP